jgi:hypothetical protein
MQDARKFRPTSGYPLPEKRTVGIDARTVAAVANTVAKPLDNG